jgi:hypothetical protein
MKAVTATPLQDGSPLVPCLLLAVSLFVQGASSIAGDPAVLSTNASTNRAAQSALDSDEDLSFLDAYEPKAEANGKTEKLPEEYSFLQSYLEEERQPAGRPLVSPTAPTLESLGHTPSIGINIAKRLRNFSGFTKQPLIGVVTAQDEDVADEDTNDHLIREWITNYAGEFTDYEWRAEPIDRQTHLVFCEVSLDGQKYDFRFKVNHELRSCRYEGGTAYEKLRSNQKKKSWLPW